MNAADNPHNVQPGQIYVDCDKRTPRHLEVIAVEGSHATVKPFHMWRNMNGHTQRNYTGRMTHIRLDRFKPTSTGYRRIS